MIKHIPTRWLAALASIALATTAIQASVFIVEPSTGSGGSAPVSDLSSTFTPVTDNPPLDKLPPVIPEPSEYAAVIGLALGAFALVRRGRKSSKRLS